MKLSIGDIVYNKRHDTEGVVVFRKADNINGIEVPEGLYCVEFGDLQFPAKIDGFEDEYVVTGTYDENIDNAIRVWIKKYKRIAKEEDIEIVWGLKSYARTYKCCIELILKKKQGE